MVYAMEGFKGKYILAIQSIIMDIHLKFWLSVYNNAQYTAIRLHFAD